MSEKPSCLANLLIVSRHEGEDTGAADDNNENAADEEGLSTLATEWEVPLRIPGDPGTTLSVARTEQSRLISDLPILEPCSKPFEPERMGEKRRHSGGPMTEGTHRFQ